MAEPQILFGLLTVQLAVRLSADAGTALSETLAAAFFVLALVFVWRSFYGMQIDVAEPPPAGGRSSARPELREPVES